MKRIILSGIALLCLASCSKEKDNLDISADSGKVIYESVKKNISSNLTLAKVFKGAQATDISFADGNVGYISGTFESEDTNRSVIAKTTDGGNTWKEISVLLGKGYKASITDIYAKSRDSVYAVYSYYGTDPTTYLSEDGGFTWAKISDGPFMDMHFVTPQIGFMINYSGLLKTQDGGKNWTRVPAILDNYLYTNENVGHAGLRGNTIFDNCLFTSENVGYASLRDGIVCIDDCGPPIGEIYKTIDGGNTWLKLSSWKEYYPELAFINDDLGYALNDIGDIFQTKDGGETWTLLNRVTRKSLSYIVAINNNDIYISAEKTVYKTNDKSETIETIFFSNGSSVGKTIVSDKNVFVLLPDDGSVLKIDID